MDQNEMNFRLALPSIREVQLATEKAQLALEEQAKAVNSLATSMATAFEGFRLHAEIQDGIVSRLNSLEDEVKAVRTDVDKIKPAS